jgi:hypothetical protein
MGIPMKRVSGEKELGRREGMAGEGGKGGEDRSAKSCNQWMGCL